MWGGPALRAQVSLITEFGDRASSNVELNKSATLNDVHQHIVALHCVFLTFCFLTVLYSLKLCVSTLAKPSTAWSWPIIWKKKKKNDSASTTWESYKHKSALSCWLMKKAVTSEKVSPSYRIISINRIKTCQKPTDFESALSVKET